MQIRRFLPGLVVPVVAALALSTAEAQVRSSWNGAATGSLEVPWPGSRPVTFDGYYTHYRLDTDGDDRFAMNGVGARLMWRSKGDSLGLPPRLGFGIFGEYAPADNVGLSLLHMGLQGDLNLLSKPLGNRLTPIASLGAGMLRSSVSGSTPLPSARLGIRSAPVVRSATSFALTPAAGVKLDLWRNLGVRGDMRDLMTFRDGTQHNWQFTAGLSFPF